ncbi:LysR family transcriptional regulator [Rhodopseudomonas sp. P2A-2r]|uniref:LysR family transcriptional regulator n=1 Tax=unclassified Rhodopseudomonas TaxID=2638247 RepID=UPI002234D33B|nr:LysR family transcriptional regulator [Rhodopseudomonas sp. P2A-2r]UZE50670.1 LysR family transcriptional regulator [Rhodopseudomonas sp. P2A-2r]
MQSWEGLDALVAVAEAGNFTRAASRLGVSISQVSREITRLEERLGSKLLVRNTRRVALTEIGRLFEQRCRQLIDDREAAFDSVTSGKDAIKGLIRLTCAISYGERTIAPIIGRFVAEHPEISVDMELTNRVLDLVADGMDLAVRIGEVTDTRLGRVQLGSRSLHVCASPAYVERHGAPTSSSDIDAHACLLGTAQRWQFKTAGQDNYIAPQGRWRCNSGFAVLDAAIQGLGLCQLPDFYVQDHLRDGTLVELLAEERPADQAIWAVFPKRSPQPSRIAALINFLQENIYLSPEARNACSISASAARLFPV